MKIENFSKNGYIILKNCISKKLISTLQREILKKIKNKSTKNSYKNFTKTLKDIDNKKLFNFIRPLNNHLFNENLIFKLLTEKKLLNCLINILGSDLAVSAESSLTINIPTTKNNYYFKDWHQEIWSGASVSNVQFWMPIFHKSKFDGQVSFIKNSHKWGHIPHSNRKPLNLPKKLSVVNTNIEIGDIVLFSTTLLHRSNLCKNPRLGLALTIKNFKYNDHSYSDNVNWKIFSYSEITKIQRILGNHYLSPFRVIDLDTKIEPTK